MSVEKEPAVHVPPGEGESVWLLGDTYTLKISGEQTGGAFTLLEAVVPLGGGPPPHIHHLEDEVFVVLEGELLFTTDGRRHGRDATSQARRHEQRAEKCFLTKRRNKPREITVNRYSRHAG